ncbi:hypothetical protein C8R44DRAFT_884916 [Mycena epipterygia]|nr:hypothetical protein C8R44DRAFT_884916 [Mycena epipterygia]
MPLSSSVTTSTAGVNDAEIEFSSVTLDNLMPLRKTGRLVFKPEEEDRLTQTGDAVLQEYRMYTERVEDVVLPPIQVRRRMLIGIILDAAVYEAQKHQPTAHVKISSNTGSRLTLDTDHLMIVPQCQREGSEVVADRITFHGRLESLDTIMVVEDAEYRFLENNHISPCLVVDRNSLLTIVEVDSLDEGSAQIEAQCLTLLKVTNRAFFAGVLTTGVVWVFFLAAANPEGVTIYRSPYLHGRAKRGLIVATLIKFMRNPGTLPQIFTVL